MECLEKAHGRQLNFFIQCVNSKKDTLWKRMYGRLKTKRLKYKVSQVRRCPSYIMSDMNLMVLLLEFEITEH